MVGLLRGPVYRAAVDVEPAREHHRRRPAVRRSGRRAGPGVSECRRGAVPSRARPPGRAVVAVWRVGGSIVSPLIVLPACQVWALWESAAQRGPQLAALPPGAATRRARRGGPWVRLVPRRETQAAKRTGDGAPEFLGRGGAPDLAGPVCRHSGLLVPAARARKWRRSAPFSFASRARLMCGRGRDGSRVSLPPPPGRWPRPQAPRPIAWRSGQPGRAGHALCYLDFREPAGARDGPVLGWLYGYSLPRAQPRAQCVRGVAAAVNGRASFVLFIWWVEQQNENRGSFGMSLMSIHISGRSEFSRTCDASPSLVRRAVLSWRPKVATLVTWSLVSTCVSGRADEMFLLLHEVFALVTKATTKDK